jgi:hypothetical protein
VVTGIVSTGTAVVVEAGVVVVVGLPAGGAAGGGEPTLAAVLLSTVGVSAAHAAATSPAMPNARAGPTFLRVRILRTGESYPQERHRVHLGTEFADTHPGRRGGRGAQ